MSSDEYAGTKITREMIERLIIPSIVVRAVRSGLFKPDELEIIRKGMRSVETGVCDLRRILGQMDQSNNAAIGEAIRQIIHGAINLGACYVETKRLLASSGGGKKGLEQRIKNKKRDLAWQSHVRECVGEIHHKTPRKPGTFIRDSIKRDWKNEVKRLAGISLPKDRVLYDFVLAELNSLKQSGRQK